MLVRHTDFSWSHFKFHRFIIMALKAEVYSSKILFTSTRLSEKNDLDGYVNNGLGKH